MKKLVTAAFATALSIGILTGVPVTKQLASNDAQARVSKKQAYRACRKKYGRRFIRVVYYKNGSYACRYKKVRRKSSGTQNYTWGQVLDICRKQKPFASSVTARKRFGKWYCFWVE